MSVQRVLQQLRRRIDPTLILVVTDIAVAYGVFILATLLRFNFDYAAAVDSLQNIWIRALMFAFWVIVGMLSMGMYRERQRPRLWELVARVIVAVVLATFANVLAFYVVPQIATGRGVLGFAVVLTAITLSISRWQLLHMVDFNARKQRILVLGAGQAASKVGQLRRRADRRRFEVVGYVPASEQEAASAADLGLEPLVSLETALGDTLVDKIVVALDERRGGFPIRSLLEKKFSGVSVTEVVEFLERETEKIDLDVLRPGWLLFAATGHTDVFFSVAKRSFDLLVSFTLLTVTSPLFLLVWLGILLEDGPGAQIFYRQRRVGLNDQPFSLLKFRSMRTDAESSGAQWAQSGDERITRVGRVIRRFRVDELPQVINVIRGEMSIVGPRPERPEFVEQLVAEIPLYDHRHCVRPGLTGWAQLNFPYGASVEDAREKLQYDLYYIKNGDVVFDLFVLLQTLEVVLWGRAVSMAGVRPASPETGEFEEVEEAEDSTRSRDAA